MLLSAWNLVGTAAFGCFVHQLQEWNCCFSSKSWIAETTSNVSHRAEKLGRSGNMG